MSNRTIRRAAERAALKAAKREQKAQAQAQPQPQTMAAAAGAPTDPDFPNVDFAEDTTTDHDQAKRPFSDAQRAADPPTPKKVPAPPPPKAAPNHP